jgi:hypothetical protein
MSKKRNNLSKIRSAARRKLKREFNKSMDISTDISKDVIGYIKEGKEIIGKVAIFDYQHYFNLHLGHGKYNSDGWIAFSLNEYLNTWPERTFEV